MERPLRQGGDGAAAECHREAGGGDGGLRMKERSRESYAGAVLTDKPPSVGGLLWLNTWTNEITRGS
jgi:hypothetical protein